MEKIVDHVLRESFPGAKTELELLEDRVTSFLLWDGFEGHDRPDRRKQVNGILAARMGPDFRDHVSMIFTMTPAEMSLMRGEVEI